MSVESGRLNHAGSQFGKSHRRPVARLSQEEENLLVPAGGSPPRSRFEGATACAVDRFGMTLHKIPELQKGLDLPRLDASVRHWPHIQEEISVATDGIHEDVEAVIG